MIEQRFKTVAGLSAPVLVYESIEEAEKVQAGELLNEANNNMVYRGVLPAIRELISELVEKETGIERQSKVVGKTKAGKDIIQWEPEGRYINRVLAEKGVEDFAHLQGQVDEAVRNYKDSDEPDAVAAPMAVDVKGHEYAAKGPGKLAAKYKNQAAVVLTNGNVARYNTSYLAKIGKSFTPSNDTTKMYTGTIGVLKKDGTVQQVAYNVSDKDAEALGRLVKEWSDWKAAEDTKAMQADLSE